MEVDYAHPDGTVVPIEINASTLGAGDDLKIVALCRDITERKRLARALVESEERLRITLETTKIGSWDWDVKKDVWYASPTYFTMLGYEPDPDHVDREQWLQRIHPDDRAATVAKIQEVLAGASSGYQYEHRIKHADGAYRWHNVIGHTVASDASGKPVRLMGVRMDITERKQAEQALGQSEATLRSLFRAAPVGISILKNRVIENINTFWCEHFGYPMESVVGQSSRMFYASDEEYDRVGQSLYGKQPEQGVAAVETKIRHSNGELRDVILTAAPLQAGDPAAGNVVVVHDVTERKRAENALRQSEERLKQSQQMARLGHYTFNAVSGNWTSSETLDEIFGIDAAFKRDIAGWSKLIHPEDRDVMLAHLQDQVLKQHDPFNKEYRIVRAQDGRLCWVHGIGELRFNISGEVMEMFGTIQDITERRQVEELLQESEQRHRLLFERMLDGFALHEIIYDDTGRPVNYRFISVNPAFERMTGLRAADVIGRTVLEVMPETESVWIERYGRVALTGEGVQFEEYSHVLKRHYEVAAFRPKPGQFAVVLMDITKRKQADLELQQANRTLRMISESDHALVHAEDDIELMRQVCRAVVELGGFRMAWVGLATSDEQRTVWPWRWPGMTKDTFRRLRFPGPTTSGDAGRPARPSVRARRWSIPISRPIP